MQPPEVGIHMQFDTPYVNGDKNIRIKWTVLSFISYEKIKGFTQYLVSFQTINTISIHVLSY